MKAVTWQGKRDVRVETVPDPRIVDPTDAIVRVTSTGICGSDLHLYETLGSFIDPGDILGHEPMGVVEEVGAEVKDLAPGDRVVIPFKHLVRALSGVYGGAISPMPLLQMFDKQITVRMGQANVWNWVDDLLPLVTGDDDPLGVDTYATHHIPLAEAPHGYDIFQKKQDGAFKVVLNP